MAATAKIPNGPTVSFDVPPPANMDDLGSLLPPPSSPPPPVHVYDFGWRGQINGLTQAERDQFLKALPISGVGRPSEVPDCGAGISSKLVMDHLHNSGEVSREEMPMDFVFEYLKILVQMNYRVVASHSQNSDSNEHCASAAVWTLQKDYSLENKSPLANALGTLLQ